MDLKEKHCIPCEGGTKPLDTETVSKNLEQTPGWTSLEGKSIERKFEFENFRGAMQFVNKVADIAEHEGHHPDVYIFFNKVRLELTTHAIGGLSENDFILAAKINALIA